MGWISFDSTNFDPNRINSATTDAIKIACKNPKIVRFLPQLVASWQAIDHDRYVAFSKIPGWREAFLMEAEKLSKDSYAPWRYELFQKKFGQLL
jgi:hypothetical protein